MRNISSSALAKINSQYGIESVIILRIFWGTGNYTDYSEKAYPDYGIEGRILTTGGIDDVISITGSGNSKSIEVTLSDHDGVLKNIFDNVDLHKVHCQVLQWFDGLPLTDAFVIFDGYINTPISWKEGDRTLSISVLSLLENLEFGFSPDESYFNLVSHNLMGQAWPVVFGTNLRSKALQINDSPSIILAEGFALVDSDIWNTDLNHLLAQAEAAYTQAKLAYDASVLASLDASNSDPGSDEYKSKFDQSQQYYAQFNQYMDGRRNLLLEYQSAKDLFDKQLALAKKNVLVISPNVPRGVPLLVNIGNSNFLVTVDGVVMTILSELKPPTPQGTSFAVFNKTDTQTQWQGQTSRQKFRWISGGTKIKVLNYPIRYVVSLGRDTIVNVMGKQQGMFVVIPPEYYTLVYTPFVRSDGITTYATTITLARPLTSILNTYGDQIWESDDVYVDVIGAAPGKMVDILVYAITNFSNLSYDPVSFALARLYTDSIPMNHVVRQRLDTLKYIEDIAFQGKCALWVKDQTVYIRYLPVEPTPADMISTNDVLENTLEITSTSTEEVVTKLTATWKFTEDQSENNQIVYRYNIQKYGLHEMDYNFFAFNDPESVGWSARYWIMRKANVFKRIKFKTDLSKLNLETWDAVTIDMTGFVSSEPVVGIIESAVYDSDQKEIEFEVWLPIRLGEMAKYNFAYPGTDIALFGDPSDAGIYTGNPFEHMQDGTGFMQPGPSAYILASLGSFPPMRPIPYDTEVGTSQEVNVDTYIVNIPVNETVPTDIETFNDYNKYEIIPWEAQVDDTSGNAFFGDVLSKVDSSNYKVKLLGSNNIVTVLQRQIGSDSPDIPNGTSVMVLKIKDKYYMQAPIWL